VAQSHLLLVVSPAVSNVKQILRHSVHLKKTQHKGMHLIRPTDVL